MSPIEWTPSRVSPVVRRGFLLKPAFDCGPDGRDCQHTEKGDHGQHCDVWRYVVAGPHFAVSLTVYAGNFPRGPIPGASRLNEPNATDLGIHHAEAQAPEYLKEYGPTDAKCYALGGRPCWYDGTSLGAEDFYKAHGSQRREEPEPFWLALEREYESRRPRASAPEDHA